MSHNSGEPEDLVLAEVRANVHEARRDLLYRATPGSPWNCQECGHEMPSPLPGQWLDPSELKRQANRFGKHEATSLGIALLGMVEDGVLETDSKFRVRLPGAKVR